MKAMRNEEDSISIASESVETPDLECSSISPSMIEKHTNPNGLIRLITGDDLLRKHGN
jgi:hypothetical protein